MNQQDDLAEAVFLFANGKIVEELSFPEFEGLINQAASIDRFAAQSVRAGYVAVGAGLHVRGVALFQLKVDDAGHVDLGFNIPLRYLVRNAGRGPDLGQGPIRLATASQCPVPWHSVNLWAPDDACKQPIEQLQKAVKRNRLGLTPRESAEPSRNASQELAERQKDVHASYEKAFKGKGDRAEPAGGEGSRDVKSLLAQHNTQLSRLAEKYRTDVAQQQQLYLDQLRACKEEIQHLKRALRQEHDRNRRLQQLLRGEVG